MLHFSVLKGKPAKGLLVEFGECVFFRPSSVPKQAGKITARLKDGVYLGFSMRSGEHFIGTSEGVMRTRDVHRKAEEDRWDGAALQQVIGAPWDLKPAEEVKQGDDGGPLEAPAPPPADPRHVPVPRRIRITKEMLERFGYTPNCIGCDYMRDERGYRMHTEACRKRLGECFQSDEILQERAARAEDRMNQWRADRQDKVGRNAPVGDDVVGSGVVNSGVLEAPEEDMQVDEDPMVQGGDETPVINPWRGDEGDATPVLSPLPENESTVYSPMGDDELEGNVDQGVGAVDDDFVVVGLDWAQIHDSVVQRLREISAVSRSTVQEWRKCTRPRA